MTNALRSWTSWFSQISRRRRLRRLRQQRKLLLESLEGRTLLAVTSLATIAGHVYTDATDNGLTPDDAGISGATVRLYRENAGGNGTFDGGSAGGDDTLVATRTTDAAGFYRFDHLEPGRYYVRQLPVAGLLQRPGTNVKALTVTAETVAGKPGDTIIDSYNSAAQGVQASPTKHVDANSLVTAEAIGGERDLFVEWLSGLGTVGLWVDQFDSNTLLFDSGSAAIGRRIITWDGPDGDATALAATGLNNVDLTEGGKTAALRFKVGADHPNGAAILRVYTNANQWSEARINIENTNTGEAKAQVIVMFSEFVAKAGGGADFSRVGAIQMEIDVMEATDGQMDDLGTIGPKILAADLANLQPLSVGDQVWRDTNNNGRLDSGETGLGGVTLRLYTDTDGNGSLTPGTDTQLASTTTDTSGKYRFSGLFPGQYIVQVDAANLAAGGPLAGLVSSTGNQPTPDPDDNQDQDDNGDPLAGQGVVARAVTLSAGGEPVNDGDSDANTNLTVDFGFAAITDMMVLKFDDVDPVVAGRQLTYRMEVTNNGPSPATGVVITDTLPAGVTYRSVSSSQGTGSHQNGIVTVQLGNMAVGTMATVTLVVDVSPAFRGTLLNEAVVAANEVESRMDNNRDTEETQVIAQVDLAIDKTDLADPAIAGQTLTYKLLVTNQGPSSATGVTVNDTLPAGLAFRSATSSQGTVSGQGQSVTASLGNLAKDGTAEITVVVDVLPATRGRVLNVATVSATEPETNTANNRDEEPTQIEGRVDLAIDKTDLADPAIAGQTLTYKLLVTNHGPSTATGVTVNDTLPTGLTFRSATSSQGTVSGQGQSVTASLGNLAKDGTAEITVVVDVLPTTRGRVLNVATVSATEPETNTANNRDEEPTQINHQVDLRIEKSDNPDPVPAGGTLTYTLLVTNGGPSTATGVNVTDTLPAGVTFRSGTTTQGTVSGQGGQATAVLGTLAPNASATITLVTDIAATAQGTLVNEARVTANEAETSTTNNVDTEPTVVQPIVDLVIFKSDSPDPVRAGQLLTYTLSVVNNGPSNATGVQVTDVLPAGVAYKSASSSQGTLTVNGSTITAQLGNLAAGATATVTIQVDVAPTTRGTITNTAEVRGNETESNPDNNRDDEPTVVRAEVDLEVTKTDSPDPVVAGRQLVYTVLVKNNGPSTATNVQLTDTLPPQVQFVSATTTQGSVSHASGVVTGTLGTVPVGGTVTVTLTTRVAEATVGTITNRAEVNAAETESNPDNNRDDEPTLVRAEVDLVVSKTDSPDPVTAGQPLVYTVVVANNGPSTATNVQLTDTLPPEVEFVSATTTQGSVSHAAGVVTGALGSVPVGGSVTVTVTTRVAANAAGTITNRAVVSSPETESNPDNNRDDEPTQVHELLSSIAGYVYVDANDDGLMNPGELPLAGVTVLLTGTDARGRSASQQAVTGSDGSYRFEGLSGGTYKLTQVQPAGYEDGRDTPGSLGGNASRNDELSDIPVPAGAAATDYLFGERSGTFSKRRFLSSRRAM